MQMCSPLCSETTELPSLNRPATHRRFVYKSRTWTGSQRVKRQIPSSRTLTFLSFVHFIHCYRKLHCTLDDPSHVPDYFCSHFFQTIYRLLLSLPLSLVIPSTPLAGLASGVSVTLASTLKSVLPLQGDQTARGRSSCFLNFSFVGPVSVSAEDVCGSLVSNNHRQLFADSQGCDVPAPSSPRSSSCSSLFQ